MSYIFLNNKIVHEDDALVSVKDRGFLYGDGIFETLRSYDGYLFNIEKHINRMKHSAACLKIPFSYSSDKIQTSVKELLRKNDLLNAYIRITLSRGVGIGDFGFRISDYQNSQSRMQRHGQSSLPRGIQSSWNSKAIIPQGESMPPKNLKTLISNPQLAIRNPQSKIGSPTFVIQVKPLKLYDPDFYNRGMSVIVSESRRSTTCPISRHKTSNFLTNIIVRDEADLKGAHEVMLLNTENYVAECSASNLFIVKGDTVITPPLNVNILAGITRETVLELCKKNAIPVKEQKFGMERLLNADECFLTNSIMEIMPVSEINGVRIGRPVPGKHTKYLMHEYEKVTKMK